MRAASLILLLALTGCGSWSKLGGSPSLAEADQTACALQAAEAHPPQMLKPPEIPAATDQQCARIYGTAQCTPIAAGQRAAQTDMNEGARHVAFQTCMADKGYRYSSQ